MSNEVPILDYTQRRRRRFTLPLWLDIIVFVLCLLLTNAFFLSLLVVMTYGIFLFISTASFR